MWGFTECRAVSGLLWNYTANRLSESEIERIERHLASCGPCRAEAATYRQTVDALGQMRSDHIPASQRGWRELQTRLAASQPRSPWFQPIRLLPNLAWGSLAAAAAVLVVFTMSHPGPSGAGYQGSPVPGDHSDRPEVARVRNSEVNSDESLHAEMVRRYGPDYEFQLIAVPKSNGSKPMPSGSYPIQVADNRSAAGRSSVAGRATQRRGSHRLDYSRMDGRSGANSGDSGDYVLTPVSVVSDSETPANYVMGSVVMTGRSADTEVARAW